MAACAKDRKEETTPTKYEKGQKTTAMQRDMEWKTSKRVLLHLQAEGKGHREIDRFHPFAPLG